MVSFWDYKSKKRVSQLTGFPNAIASMDFNADGSKLAIASSYMYENGQQAYSRSLSIILVEAARTPFR